MSLIVLNSKGNDPEHFTNSCSSGIKIPCNAEISLVSSNVQQRYIPEDQVIISAGSNSLVFGVGSGRNPNTATRTDGDDYTPHLPYPITLRQPTGAYPIILNTGPVITDFLKDTLDFIPNILASNYTGPGAWQVAINLGTGVITANCAGTVPDPAIQIGDSIKADIIGCLGSDNTQGSNNITTSFTGTVTQGTVAFAGGCTMRGAGYYIDKNPIWNTTNYTVQGTWDNLTGALANQGVEGGASYWDISPRLAAGEEKDKIIGLKGGFLENGFGLDQPPNTVNALMAPLTGGSDYACWWEVIDYRAAGNIKIGFFYRKVKVAQNLRKKSNLIGINNFSEVIQFGEIDQPVVNGANGNIRIMMRCNTKVIGAGNVYVVDAGYARATPAGILQPALAADDGIYTGYVKITDPFAVDGGTATESFDLYQRLPLRQGYSIPSTASVALRSWMGTVHHTSRRRAAPSAGISHVVFATQRPLQNDYFLYKPDKNLQYLANKATLGDTLGCYNFSGWEELTAAGLFTGGTGLISQDINTVTPYNDCLVVQCPTLQVNGLMMNQSGSRETGTATISAGGNPAPIIGVIPAPNTTLRGALRQPDDRRAFFAQPVDNWIQLNNTTPYVINQLEIKITNALGSKPNKLDGTSTIVIKIREHRRTSTVVQGAGSNPQPINYLKPGFKY